MGADLYIDSITDAAREQHKPRWDGLIAARNAAKSMGVDYSGIQSEITRVYDKMYPAEGYFRDPYNEYDLLWRFGLSWWKDVGAMIKEYGSTNGNSEIGPEQIRRLLAIVDTRQDVPLEGLQDEIADEEGIQEYFNQRRDAFVAFLNNALELGEPIYCSI